MSAPGNPADGAGGTLLEGTFSGSQAFAQLVRDALEVAARDGWKEMVWSDASFHDWPLRERAVVDCLNAWARPGRKLVMLAQSYDAVRRNKHRFVEWRIRWDHLVECRVGRSVNALGFTSALWSPVWAMRRLDLVRSTGMAGTEPQRRLLLREELEESRRQSLPGFPASTLGL